MKHNKIEIRMKYGQIAMLHKTYTKTLTYITLL